MRDNILTTRFPIIRRAIGKNGSLEASGKLSGSRFVVDTQTNSTLSRFGGILPAQLGPFEKRVSTFRLYVDGRLVASKDFPYEVVHR